MHICISYQSPAPNAISYNQPSFLAFLAYLNSMLSVRFAWLVSHFASFFFSISVWGILFPFVVTCRG